MCMQQGVCRGLLHIIKHASVWLPGTSTHCTVLFTAAVRGNAVPAGTRLLAVAAQQLFKFVEVFFSFGFTHIWPHLASPCMAGMQECRDSCMQERRHAGTQGCKHGMSAQPYKVVANRVSSSGLAGGGDSRCVIAFCILALSFALRN